MSNGANALRGFVYQLYVSLVRALDNRVRVIDRYQEDHQEVSAQVGIILEGEADLAQRCPAGIELVQVKSRRRGTYTWTLRALMEEVLCSFRPDAAHEPLVLRRTFVTDAALDHNCDQLAELSDRLAECASPSDSEETWTATADTLDASDIIFDCGPAGIWDNRLLRCSGTELLPELAQLGALPGCDTPAQVARFLSTLCLVGEDRLDDLAQRAKAELARRVPIEKVAGFENQLLTVVLRKASLTAGTEFTTEELLREVGIMGHDYSYENLVTASRALLSRRLQRIIPSQAPTYALRDHAHDMFDYFLATDDKLLVITGHAKSGKTRLSCALADSCADVVVYWQQASQFRFDAIGEELCRELGHEAATTLGTLALFRRLDKEGNRRPALMVFLDALNEADLQRLDVEMGALREALAESDMKVVVTCGEFHWPRMKSTLEDWRELAFEPTAADEPLPHPETREFPTIGLSDFTDDELAEAMRINLLNQDSLEGEEPISLGLKGALLHPEMFGLYCLLTSDRRRRIAGKPAVAAVEICAEYWKQVTDSVAIISHKHRDVVSDRLVAIARQFLVAADQEYTLPRKTLVDNLDENEVMAFYDTDPSRGVYPAYLDKGLLHELGDDDQRVRFGQQSVLEYGSLLCLLEESLDKDDEDAVAEWCEELMRGAIERRYDPLLGAIALLIQRLTLDDKEESAVGVTRGVLSFWQQIGMDEFFHHIGDFAVPSLRVVYSRMQAEDSVGWYTARQAGKALLALQTKASTEALLEGLRSDSAEIRAESARLLGQADGLDVVHDVVEGLVDSLADQNDDVVRNATRSLVQIGIQAVSQLIGRLNDKQPSVATGCAGALGAIGCTSAIPAVEHALAEATEPRLLGALLVAAGQLGYTKVSGTVIECLQHRDVYVRSRAAYALNFLKTPEAAGPLKKLLQTPKDQDHLILEWALSALRAMGEWEPVLAYLTTAASRTDWPVSGVLAMWRIAELHRPESVPALLMWLVDTAPGQHNRVWQALRRLTLAETLEEVQALRQLRHDQPELWSQAEEICYNALTQTASPDDGAWRDIPSDIRRFAKSVLLQLGSERALEGMGEALCSKDHFLRLEIVKTMGLVGDHRALAYLDITSQAQTEDWDIVRRAAAKSIGLVNGARALDALLGILKGDSPVVRYAALHSIIELPRDDIDTAGLRELLLDTDAHDNARWHAAYALGAIEACEHSDGLLTVAEDDSASAELRSWCMKALGWLDDDAVVPIARALLGHEDTALRRGAVEALCRLQCSECLPDIRGLIENAAPEERAGLTWCVGWLETSKADDMLYGLAGEDNDRVRNEALGALHRHGDPRAVTLARCVLADKTDTWVTTLSEQTAALILAEASSDVLVKLIEKVDLIAWTQHLKIVALDGLVTKDAHVDAASLRDLMLDLDPWVQRRAARTVAICSPSADAEQTLRALSEEGPEQAAIVADALMWFDTPWAERLLCELAEHDFGQVRRSARRAEEHRARRGEARRIVAAFRAAESGLDRWPFGKALEVIGDEDSIDQLRQAMENENPQQREHAAHVIEAVTKRLKKLERDLPK